MSARRFDPYLFALVAFVVVVVVVVQGVTNFVDDFEVTGAAKCS